MHIDGQLLKFMCATKSLDVLSQDVYILIVLKAKDVRKKMKSQRIKADQLLELLKRRRAKGISLC